MQISKFTILRIKLRKMYYLAVFHLGRTPLRYLGWSHLRSRRALPAVFLVLVIGAILVNMLSGVPVRAQTKTFSPQDIQDGLALHNQVAVGSNGTSFGLQQGNLGQWSGGDGLQRLTTQVRGDTNLVWGPNGSLYFMTNMSGCHFQKYVEEFQSWYDLRTPPMGCGSGSTLVFDGTSYMYYLPGGGSPDLFRYDIGQDSWSRLADAPSDTGNGASATYINSGSGAIFVLRGNSSAGLTKYDVATNTWSVKAPFPTTGTVTYGLSMAWDGSGTIYAIGNRGGEFKAYSIATDTWSVLPSADGGGCPTHSLVWAKGALFDVDLRLCDNRTQLQKYDPSVNSWTTKADLSVGQEWDYHILPAFDGSDTLYTLAGAWERPQLYKYSISSDKWLGYSVYQVKNPGWGYWKPMYDGGNYAYYIGGWGWGSMDRIYRMDLRDGTVTQVGSQYNTNNGITGTYSNNALYTVDWFGGTQFWKYDLASSTWVQLPDMPHSSDWGSDLVDGGDGYLYATFAWNNDFYRFSEAGGWQKLANMPQSPGTGSGVTRIGTSIYVMAGRQTRYLEKYDMTTGIWTYATDLPSGSIDHGGFLTSDNTRYLYADMGTRTDDQNARFYRYDTTNGTWQRMADMPESTGVGAYAFYDSVRNQIWTKQGTYDSHIWSWSPTTNAYVSSGSWYSKPIDLTQVQSWTGLQVNSTGSGTVTTYTRTSANGRIWTDWQQVGGTAITSPVNRFIQVKVSLSGDGTATPTVTGLVLNYAQEAVAPNLPSQLTAYSKKGGDVLTSGDKYEYEHPYFTWSGASDGTNGSGVDGYYVYYGTDSNADPAAEGDYQTTSDYTVTTAMTAGDIYYLRIKVKDKLGNISDAATFFSYLYYYISPPGSQIVSGKSDISAGTNSGVSIAGDGTMSLTQQPQGAWSVGPQQQLPANPYGGAMQAVGQYVYVLRGNNSGDFWRYDTATGTWLTLAAYPDTSVYSGSALTWDNGNYLYAVTGHGKNTFYRYNIQNDAWETLPILPAFAQSGTDARFIGNNRLAIIFSGSTEFYIYDIAAQTFTSMASAPTIINGNSTGSGMWWDGKDTVYVYFGPYDRYSYNRTSLAKYSISQDYWRTLSIPSFDPWYSENNLVGDGHGHLYIFGNDYYLNQQSNAMAEVYDIASDTWSSIPNSIAQDIRGTITSDNNRYVYIIPSWGNDRRIIRYDTWTGHFSPEDTAIPSWQRIPWDDQSSWNWQAGNSTTAAYDGSEYIYAIGANEGNWSRFMKRSVKDGSTTYLPPPPYVGIGGTLTFQSGTLYYTMGANTNFFYKFDMSNQNWIRLANTPGNIYRPGAGTLIALKDGTLLQFGGNNRSVYKYTPGSNSWATMASTPSNIYQGGAVYDGNNTVYVLAGNNNTTFYAYNVSANTWSTVASIPKADNYSAPMMIRNGKIYAAIGNNSTAIEIYDTASNTWQDGPDAPEYFRYGSIMVPINNQYGLVIAGQDSIDLWRYDFPASNQAYQAQATHISQPIQIDGLFDYAGVQATVTETPDTSIEVWTRTSADGNTWDDWVMSDNVKQYMGSLSALVESKPQKFTQVKFVMISYDNLYTPTITNYSLDYYFDVTPPTNPTVEHTYSDSTKTTELASNVWHNNAKPVFDWPDPGEAGGATDGPLGSHIKGYYVYLGTDPTAVPQTAGTFVPISEYSPTMTTSGTYYLRLQAVDVTGNVDSSIFGPYIYKFDNVPPTNPALITVTPAGFTANNKYTFEWPNGFDGDSGVDQYCYHTGALSGPFAVETCQKELTVKDISAAYQSGTNAFYLRTRDVAGNYSPSYTAVSYYYSTDPPTPVVNLRAVPPTSDQNLFAFVWDLPVMFSGDPSQLQYCYSINALPSPTNTTCTTDRFISAFKAATQQGTNIIYMVAKDEAGNVNWNNYASANFIANTVSPGIPLNLTVDDTSNSATGKYSLTLTWDPPTFQGNGITQYVIERSIDDHTYTQIGRVSNTAYVDLTVQSGKSYYYRVRAADNVDNEGGPSAVVEQSAKGNYNAPPAIVSEPKAASSFDQATITWVTDRPSTSFVYYGTSPTQLSESKGTLDTTTEHSVVITGLKASTTYYFKVQSFDNNRSYDISTAYSQLYTLKTAETASIFNVQSANPTLSSILLSWQTSVETTSQVQYGLTRDYGFTQDDDSGSTASHIFQLGDLASGTTYHYRIVSTTAYGSQIYSDDYTFTTIARPRVTNITFQPVDTANTLAVQVSWTTNVPTSSEVDYSALGTKKAESAPDLVLQHQIVINDLASSTDYEFTIQGRDQYGNQATSERQIWHSGVDTKAPTITQLSISPTTVDGSGNAKAQLIISWHTDEPSTTQVLYGPGSSTKLDKKSAMDPQPTVDHVVVLSGLDLAQVYRIQPVTRDISGNTTYGAKLATVTPDRQVSPLDVVLDTLQRIFRF